MNNRFFLCSRAVLLSVLIFLISGCSVHRPETNPMLDQKAFASASRIKAKNESISASKGMGWATIRTPETINRFRIAWAAVYPGKIRITFLLSGFPVESIAADGEKITFFSHTGEHAAHSYKSKDPDMKKYVHVPVKLSEIILMLLGRFPVKDFDDAYFSPGKNNFSDIVLRQAQEQQMQIISMDSSGKPKFINQLNFMGNLVYNLTIDRYETYKNTEIPARIIAKDRLGRTLELDITTFKPNPLIKDEIFQLTDSRS